MIPFFTRIYSLAKKEFFSSIVSPAFSGITVFFLLFVSVRFYYIEHFFVLNTASLRSFFSSFPVAYIFVIPALTMKSWAEERKTGTIEILLAMPFSEWELCLGKFFSSFAALVVMILLTVPVPLSLLPLGRFDPGVIASEYAGVLLLGSSSISLGLFFSVLSKNQAASFLGSCAVLLALLLPTQMGLASSLPAGLSDRVNYFSLSFHFESFSRGLLDSRDLAFFILSSALFLFLNTRILISRKWG